MHLVRLVVLLCLTSVAGAQDLDGFWKDDQEPGSLYRFTVLASGVAVGELVEKTGADASAVYQNRNPSLQGRPLLGTRWIWGLHPGGTRFWGGGLAIDTRDDGGNVYFCRVSLSPDGRTLTLESVPGLSPDHRPLVLTRWDPPKTTGPPPKQDPPGNLLPDLWAESPEEAAKKEPPKPILGKEADKIVFGTVYYGLILVIIALTAVALVAASIH